MWDLFEASPPSSTTGSEKHRRATLIYHSDGYKETVDLSGPNSPEWVSLKKGVPRPSVLLQAKSHAKYYLGLRARSVAITAPIRDPICASPPMLVLPDAKQAKLFDTDVMHNTGGLKTLIKSDWQNEKAGDLLVQMNGSKVQHTYVLAGHLHGYAVNGGNVSYPGQQSPTRIGCRLERTGRGPGDVALCLGAKDGGIAKEAGHVKFYELPPVADSDDKYSLRIIHRHFIVDVSSPSAPTPHMHMHTHTHMHTHMHTHPNPQHPPSPQQWASNLLLV